MTRPLVYIAGPITGDPWGCVRKALSVETFLYGFGVDCFLPQLSVLAEIVRHRPHDHYMRVDMNVFERCEGLGAIKGGSVGPAEEFERAKVLGLPVHSEGNQLRFPFSGWIDAVRAQALYRSERDDS